MTGTKRQKIGILGSVIVHLLIFLLVAGTGILHLQHAQPENIVEVALFGGGGGGGGGGSDADDATIEESAPAIAQEEAEAPEQEEPLPDPDAIHQADKDTPPVPPKPIKQTKPPVLRGTGTGTGGGHGSGMGTGTGSGTGPGSGSGSGGGHGSGHGTGTGSGYGSGSGGMTAPAIPPRLVRNPQPVYPAAERNAGIGGTVMLRLLVNTSGNVEDITVNSSSGNANLDQAAINACYSWKFTSARNQAGQNIRCYLLVPITFRMRK